MRIMTAAKTASRRVWRRGEHGQAIILLVGIVTIIFVVAAIVIDFGLWLSERRSVQRAADFAALAGAQDLLIDDYAAIDHAVEWAAKNGFQDSIDGVEVTAELLCKNTMDDPPAGICTNTNPSGTGPSACQAGSGCDSLRVRISKPATHLFTSIFGIGGVHIASGAAAGLDVNFTVPLDAVLLLDATGSMGSILGPSPCDDTQSNDGCPIKEARDAANNFVDILLDRESPVTQVGFAPYRGCYNPPRNYANCVPGDRAVDLTDDADLLHSGIDSTDAVGGSGTNICLALSKAQQLLNGPRAQTGPGLHKVVVLLTDGDNVYNLNAYGEGQPPPECRPQQASTPDDFVDTSCRAAQTRERDLDVETFALANQLGDQGVEIYVVGLSICGVEDDETASDGYCSGIGDGAHDDLADQRLLKCIASSPEHYFRIASAQELPDIFQDIAWEIVGRGLLQ